MIQGPVSHVYYVHGNPTHGSYVHVSTSLCIVRSPEDLSDYNECSERKRGKFSSLIGNWYALLHYTYLSELVSVLLFSLNGHCSDRVLCAYGTAWGGEAPGRGGGNTAA